MIAGLEPFWWRIGFGAWAILGAALASIFLWTDRKSLRSDDDRLTSLGAAAVLALAAPILVLYGFGWCLWTLAREQVPLSRARLWGRRDVEETGSSSAALVDMIALRRRRDPALRGRPPPDQWPMAALWPTPEGIVLEIIELHTLLRADGMTDQQTIERIETWRRTIAVAHDPPPSELQVYIKFRLQLEAPGYPIENAKLFTKVMARAGAYAAAALTKTTAEPWPPVDWLEKRIGLIDLDYGTENAGFVNEHSGEWSPYRRAFSRIALRMRDDDELWTFASPPETWRRLMGRRGVALVRQGKAIEHVVLEMN